ncbi:MAG: DEAD/DEAH box helicase [Patescibacteria group bacterium]
MTNQQIGQFFQTTNVNIMDNAFLREPQIGGYQAACEHFSRSRAHAILQIPVGCGKTGLMSILPFGMAEGRVLIIVPNLEIRRGVAHELDITNNQCFWNKAHVLRDYSTGPYRAELDSDANIHDCRRAHFVITNIHQLANRVDRWLPKFEDNFFDLILVDEAHHNAAESWQRVFERFPNAKVISLTATPFRSDGRPVEGQSIYRYSFAEAMRNGYIKQLRVADAQPAQIYFTFQGDEYHHSLEEVLALREEAWFRLGIALSRPTNETIVNSSLELLDRLRSAGRHHQIVAAACSINHARDIASLYRERNYSADVISSDMRSEERESVLQRLKCNQLDCIVQVNILGEGFDWPQLSVAAIFRPFRSLAPYIQFVGRIMRVLEQNDPYHPDNEGWVISHIGLQQDERWEDFQRFDEDDQELFRNIAHGNDPGPREGNGSERRRLKPDMRVINEVLDRLVTRDFLDPTDAGAVDAVLAEMRRTLGVEPEEIGLSREELAGRLLQARRREQVHPRPRPVQPQDRRREQQRRLDEAARSVAGRILEVLGLSPSGVDIIRRMPELASAHNNIGAAIRLMHRKVNESMGFQPGHRRELDIPELEQALEHLDEYGDVLEAELRHQLGR